MHFSSVYAFCVLKCGKKDCPFHKEPRLPPVIFDDLHPLPDPTLSDDLIHYKTFEEVYGKNTDEHHMPSSQPATKKDDHGMSISPSAQTALCVRRTVHCLECDKPRVLYAARKLKKTEITQLDRALDHVDYTCGTILGDYVEDSGNGPEPEILSKVFARQNLKCRMTVEIPYYSSAAFPLMCCYCASGANLATGEAAVDIYPTCKDYLQNRPKFFKRKRKLFEPSS